MEILLAITYMEQYEQKLRKIRQKFYFLNYFCNIKRIQKSSINRTPQVSSEEKNYSTRLLTAQPTAGLAWSGVISCWQPAASIRAAPGNDSPDTVSLYLLIPAKVENHWNLGHQLSSVQSLSHVRLFTTTWNAAR